MNKGEKLPAYGDTPTWLASQSRAIAEEAGFTLDHVFFAHGPRVAFDEVRVDGFFSLLAFAYKVAPDYTQWSFGEQEFVEEYPNCYALDMNVPTPTNTPTSLEDIREQLHAHIQYGISCNKYGWPHQTLFESLHEAFTQCRYEDCTWRELVDTLTYHLAQPDLVLGIMEAILKGMSNRDSASSIVNETASLIQPYLDRGADSLRGLMTNIGEIDKRLGLNVVAEYGSGICFIKPPVTFEANGIDLPLIHDTHMPVSLHIDKRGGTILDSIGEDSKLGETDWITAHTDKHDKNQMITSGAWDLLADRVQNGLKCGMDLVDVSVADHERGREVGMPLNISLDAPASQAILRLVGIAMEGARGPRPPLYRGANTTARNRTKELRKEMDGRMLVAMSLWANAAPWAPNPTTMVFGTAALECLLGDDTKADITSKLADRCMMLLEPEGQYREKARAFIVDLYKARCDIVHGSFDFVQTERIKELKSLLASVMIAMIEWLRVAESQGHERDDIKSLSLIEELDRFMRSGGVTWADGPGVARDPVYLNFVRRYWVPQEELDPTKDFLLLAKPDWYQEMVLVT